MIAIALPLSKFLISLSQIILLITWISDGSIKDKIASFFNNKLAVLFASVFLMHLLGLLYTSDFEYGIEDLKKKIPLLLIPLIFSRVKPLNVEKFHVILLFFVASVLLSSLISFYIITTSFGKELVEIRDAFIFVSHIRLSLMISFSSFISFYFFHSKIFPRFKLLFFITGIWFLFFLLKAELLTGIIVFLIVLAFLFYRMLCNLKNSESRFLAFSAFFGFIFLVSGYFIFEIVSFINSNNQQKIQDLYATSRGEMYIHDTTNTELENGNYIWHNIAPNEVRNAWALHSKIPIDSKDLKGNDIYVTLIRYLTSKGVRKDADGLNALTSKDIKLIENGIVNNDFHENFNFRNRVRNVIWEIDQYNKGYNFNGHSVTMRFEFWKAAVGIISKNIFFGVGTGDVKSAYQKEYQILDSPLSSKWRLRSHNQFLAIAVAFGFIGLSFFLFSLVYPFTLFENRKNYFYFIFFIISVSSMINEDTLETQVGVTFFAFFNSFLIFLRPYEIPENKIEIPLDVVP